MNQATREARTAFVKTDGYDFRNNNLEELRLDSQALTGTIASLTRKLTVANNARENESASAKASRENDAKRLAKEISNLADRQTRITRKVSELETQKNKARAAEKQREDMGGRVPPSAGTTSSMPPKKRLRYEDQQDTIDIGDDSDPAASVGNMTIERFFRSMAAHIHASDDVRFVVRDLNRNFREWSDATRASWLEATNESVRQQESTRQEIHAVGAVVADAINRLTRSTDRLGDLIAERFPVANGDDAEQYFPQEETGETVPEATGLFPDAPGEAGAHGASGPEAPTASFTDLANQGQEELPDGEPITPDDDPVAPAGNEKGGESQSGNSAGADAAE